MNDTPRNNRLQIAIFGRRNAGKSSLINVLAGHVVADSGGTRAAAEPVEIDIDIPPLGPVALIDTVGLDYDGEMGVLLVKRSLEVIKKAQMILLVVGDCVEIGSYEQRVIDEGRSRHLPVIVVAGKSDANFYSKDLLDLYSHRLGEIPVVPVSAKTGEGLGDLKMVLVRNAPGTWNSAPVIGDLLKAGDAVILAVAADRQVAKGQLAPAHIEVLRDIIDSGCQGILIKEEQLAGALAGLKQPPCMVVADSQAFMAVNGVLPEDVPLTTFSVLFARYKGDLKAMVEGTGVIDELRGGDKVLVCNACRDRFIEDDVGAAQLSSWLSEHAGGQLTFTNWQGRRGFPEDLSSYKLVLHCGACMISRNEMLSRLMEANAAKVPVVNTDVALAYMKGLLPRVLSPFMAKEN